MVRVHTIDISPPLINSSCAWASEFSQLRELYDCPFTGAVTTRTATLSGFEEDQRHSVVFTAESLSSLNSYGYSPHPLSTYIGWVYELLTQSPATGRDPTKPVIISITDVSPDGLVKMLLEIESLRQRLKAFHHERSNLETNLSSLPDPSNLVAVELNTSCPNIPNHPPPSYDLPTLAPFLDVLAASFQTDPSLTIGLKLPPYLYSSQFRGMLEVLGGYSHVIGTDSASQKLNPFAYIACTNTLGSSLLFSSQAKDSHQDPFSMALPTAFGGLAGEAIHPLALGNVHAFSQQLAAHLDPAVQSIKIFGIGGVTSRDAVSRMHQAGAHVVGCATFLGQKGIGAFELLTKHPDNLSN